MKPLITGYGTGSVIGAGYRSEPSVTAKDVSRATEYAFTGRRAALERVGEVVGICENLTMVKCHRCEGRFEATLK